MLLFVYAATPVIVTHPRSVVSKEGHTNISLSCSAHDYGEDSLKYKWEKYQASDDSWIRAFKNYRKTISPKLVFNAIAEENEGVYRCVVSNHDGNVTSNNATISVFGRFVK